VFARAALRAQLLSRGVNLLGCSTALPATGMKAKGRIRFRFSSTSLPDASLLSLSLHSMAASAWTSAAPQAVGINQQVLNYKRVRVQHAGIRFFGASGLRRGADGSFSFFALPCRGHAWPVGKPNSLLSYKDHQTRLR
jgi:hypothetical protein